MTSTRSRNRSTLSAWRPPLVGRLYEMATISRVATMSDQARRQHTRLGGPLTPAPKTTVLSPGSGKTTAVQQWLRHLDAMRRTRGRPVVACDPRDSFGVLGDLAGCELLDLSGSAGLLIDPFMVDRARSNAPHGTAGEW